MDSEDTSSFPEIDLEYKHSLKNLDQANKPLLICFSGAPGSGKTTLAKKLEAKFKGVRISGSEINDTMYHLGIDVKKNHRRRFIIDYSFSLLDQLKEGKNKLLILDSSIDRKYREVYKWSKANNFHMFIISIKVGIAELTSRIKARNSNDHDYLKRLDKWVEDQRKFDEQFIADFYLDTGAAYELEQLSQRVRERLR